MKTKYEVTIGFIKTSFSVINGLFEETEPHAFRLQTLFQIDKNKVRGYK